MYFPCADASSDSGACATQKSTVYFPFAKEHHTFPMCTQTIGIYSQRALYSSHGSHVQKITIHLKRALCNSHVQLQRVPCISKEHSTVPMRNSKKPCI